MNLPSENFEYHDEEKKIFLEFLKKKNLNFTDQRMAIVDTFLKYHGHISQEDMYFKLKDSGSKVGMTTVYRTLKLLCESGIAQEIVVDGQGVFYEHAYNHRSHDHIVCTECDTLDEVFDQRFEEYKEGIYKKFGYKRLRCRVVFYGVCQKCQGKH